MFKKDENGLIILDTVPVHMRRDYMIKNDNIKNAKDLCVNCSGTGNQLYSAWQKCEECGGSGIAQEGDDE